MIRASKIMLFMDAEKIPTLLEDDNLSWELAEFAEDMAGQLVHKKGKKVVLGLELVPIKRRPSRRTVGTALFHSKYVENITSALDGCDGIGIIPGLYKASEAPDWLKKIAEDRYIPLAPLASFVGDNESAWVFRETSRKRKQLLLRRIPKGRDGRGSRTK